jgi:hypothetical protein
MTIPTQWQKSSFSGGGEGNDSVEIANLPTRIAVRDSKAPAEGVLSFPPGSFTAFVEALKNAPTPGVHRSQLW